LRIGIDMLGVQSPDSRGRGIGRYARSLVSSMLARGVENDYVLYAHEGLSTDDFPRSPHVEHRPLGAADDPGQATDRLARLNPDKLDALLVLSPFEIGVGFDPPPKPLNGLVMAAVLYDVVPFLFQERYLTWPPAADRLYRGLERLRRYDVLLAISEATRKDAEDLLDVRGGEGCVVNISTASDPAYFTPSLATPESERILRQVGIDRPFVFCVAGLDWRKNLDGLLDGLQRLPQDLRSGHQFVLTFALSEKDRAHVRGLAAARGLEESLVLTGGIPDETLRELYRHCAVFAFPSFYEGFGLPLLEAMHCGAVVVAGNNSSQIEVVGDAGLLANAHDAGDIAAKIERALTDRELGDRLRARALDRSQLFRWENTADRALAAIAAAVRGDSRRPRRRVDQAHRSAKPRLAIFSPWPPKASGISDYAFRLAGELTRFYAVDLYHDHGYEPDLGPEQGRFGVHHFRTFDARAAALGYHGALFQMGNSYYHNFVYDLMEKHRGVVTLHDFGLAGFHDRYSRLETADRDHFAAVMRRSHPFHAVDALRRLPEWEREEGGLAEACTRRRLWMNRDVFERAGRVVVHSPWCLQLTGLLFPEHVAKTAVIPHGATPVFPSLERRRRVRLRHGWPSDALIFGCFGIVHRNKMSAETVHAFAQVADQLQGAVLVFAGQDLTDGEPLGVAESLGVRRRVQMLGRRTIDEFHDLIAAVDVGICLRRPPTSGETSGALLNLLMHGVPTIVTDVATFGDYPTGVVRKVDPETGSVEGISRAMLDLARDRWNLGEAGLRHVIAHHTWPAVAEKYAEQVELLHRERGLIVGRTPRATSLQH
jgi:glycosyltransferase involved in cell wall biosynthesis